MDNLNTRYMTIALTLSSGTFSNGTTTKYIYANSGVGYLDAECVITNAIGQLNNTAYINICGMTLDDVNTFTRANLGNKNQLITDNQVDIYAGYDLNNNGFPPLVYTGQVRTSAPDFNNPDRPFNIISMQTLIAQNINVLPVNPTGQMALDDLFRTIIKNLPYNYTYQGVNVTGYAYNPIYFGDPISQLKNATNDYGYHYVIDRKNILIALKGQPLTLKTYKINSDNGMLGYPLVEEFGISVRVRFNPLISIGQLINVTSSFEFANGDWYINAMEHVLQNKKSKWESILKLNRYFGVPA